MEETYQPKKKNKIRNMAYYKKEIKIYKKRVTDR